MKIYSVHNGIKTETKIPKGQELKNGLIYFNDKLEPCNHNATVMSYWRWTWEFYIKGDGFTDKFKGQDWFDIRNIIGLILLPILWPYILFGGSLWMKNYLKRDNFHFEVEND